MSSLINPAHPIEVSPTTVSVRDNFTAAKAEIEDLQTTKQPLDANLTAIAALAPAENDFLIRGASAWITKTVAQVNAIFGLGTAAYTETTDYEPSGSIASLAADILHDSAFTGSISSVNGVSHAKTLTTFTIPANNNMLLIGPVAIALNSTVTLAAGSVLIIQ